MKKDFTSFYRNVELRLGLLPCFKLSPTSLENNYKITSRNIVFHQKYLNRKISVETPQMMFYYNIFKTIIIGG